MTPTLIAFLALLSLPVLADETVKIYPPGSARDVLEKAEEKPAQGGAVIVKKDCTNSAGKVVKKGQPGYEACLEHRMQKAQTPRPPIEATRGQSPVPAMPDERTQ
jgi:hypothetical protein